MIEWIVLLLIVWFIAMNTSKWLDEIDKIGRK